MTDYLTKISELEFENEKLRRQIQELERNIVYKENLHKKIMQDYPRHLAEKLTKSLLLELEGLETINENVEDKYARKIERRIDRIRKKLHDFASLKN